MNSRNLKLTIARMAKSLDDAGKSSEPIRTYATTVDLIKAGIPRGTNGRFYFQTHPLQTLNDVFLTIVDQKPVPAPEREHTPGCVCKPCIAKRRASNVERAGVARAAMRPAHPTVRPEGAPPLSNTGETEVVKLVLDGGKLKEVMVRRPSHGQIAMIDTVSFTVHESTFNKSSGVFLVSDDDFINEASRVLLDILGFGISSQRSSGMNFYRMSWVLGDDFGNVCFGGQRDTLLVTLNGSGCLNAAPDWETRLQSFLSSVAVRPVITRLDLAHDDFSGAYTSVEFFDNAFDYGGFSCGFGSAPNIEHLGNWKNPTGKGRTLAIGKRTSGKYCRIYEKGREQGDASSEWVRTEVEFKSSDRVIPFLALTDPSGFFIAAYPCFSLFSDEIQPVKIAIKKKAASITIESALENTFRQFGKYIHTFRFLYDNDSALLDRLCNDSGIPDKLKKAGASIASCPLAIHLQSETPFDLDKHLSLATTFAQRGVMA